VRRLAVISVLEARLLVTLQDRSERMSYITRLRAAGTIDTHTGSRRLPQIGWRPEGCRWARRPITAAMAFLTSLRRHQKNEIVSNPDGTQTLKTLAEAGVASINLIEDKVSRSFSDGSTIDGQTTFTRTDGTTGTAATVSLVYEATGHALSSTTTHNADGSTTIDNKELNSDGAVASENILTTSADGKSKTLSTDINGDGVIDLIQTDVTVVNANGSTTETVTNKTAAGVTLDKMATTTSADGKTVTIQRYAKGGAFVQVKSMAIGDERRSRTLSRMRRDNVLKNLAA
jgi:hypothetical protein